MSILAYLETIPDPRASGKVKHNLSSVLFVTLCAVISGSESWSEVSDYCELKLDWLSKYVDLSNGVPSEWTFRRLFTLLEPRFIEEMLQVHASAIVKDQGQSDHIVIDGKALRGSSRIEQKSLHSVSAWCHENGLVLGEEQVGTKSNEITAIPLLLNALNLKGSTVSIDAAGCQKSIVELIRAKKGHYVLGLKKNQRNLYKAVKSHIEKVGESDKNRLADAFDHSHHRCVRRRYFGYDIQSLPESSAWTDAKSVIAVESISQRAGGDITASWRYYLTSHCFQEENLPPYIRNHWSIENKLHWVLDVQMKEDDDRKAERKSVRSFALLRRIALNIVRTKDKTPKRSVKRKLRRASMDNGYLTSLLI